jgi:hypothetical protein
VNHLLAVILAAQRNSGELDLEAIETATRDAMHRAGAALLSKLLSSSEAAPPTVPCPRCGRAARYHDTRPKRLHTVLGAVELERAYYHCPNCHRGLSPLDRKLDIEFTACSPGVRRMIGVVGSETSFEHARLQLELLAGLELTTKTVERQAEAIGADIAAGEQTEIRKAKQLELPEVCVPSVPVLYIEMDGTGVPVAKSEIEGRTGKKEGQPARTREVKLGCVFTQTATDERGRPVRDEHSTTYTAAIETAAEFGLRIYTEAWRRGWSRAKKKVVIGDGAIWIWNLADQHFPGAVQIVDLYHARQHLWELSAKLFSADENKRQRWTLRIVAKLNNGKIEAVVNTLRQLHTNNEELARQISNEADYFQRNRDRMRYPCFRSQGLFVGSGVVEAGCRTVIAERLKRSGMFWSVRGANAIIALRCCRLSRKFDDYWEARSTVA